MHAILYLFCPSTFGLSCHQLSSYWTRPLLSIAACTYCTFVDLSTFYQRAFYLPISIIMSVLSFASSFFVSFFSVFSFSSCASCYSPYAGPLLVVRARPVVRVKAPGSGCRSQPGSVWGDDRQASRDKLAEASGASWQATGSKVPQRPVGCAAQMLRERRFWRCCRQASRSKLAARLGWSYGQASGHRLAGIGCQASKQARLAIGIQAAFGPQAAGIWLLAAKAAGQQPKAAGQHRWQAIDGICYLLVLHVVWGIQAAIGKEAIGWEAKCCLSFQLTE